MPAGGVPGQALARPPRVAAESRRRGRTAGRVATTQAFTLDFEEALVLAPLWMRLVAVLGATGSVEFEFHFGGAYETIAAAILREAGLTAR